MSCELCERDNELTSHHLIPKQVHSKGWYIKAFTKHEMNQNRANLCRDCHVYIHKKFNHYELGKHMNTIEKLKSNIKVIKFISFIQKQTKKAKIK